MRRGQWYVFIPLLTLNNLLKGEYECGADVGNPKPKIFWFYKNEIVGEGKFFQFTPKSDGSRAEIMCTAENFLGKSSHRRMIDIQCQYYIFLD